MVPAPLSEAATATLVEVVCLRHIVVHALIGRLVVVPALLHLLLWVLLLRTSEATALLLLLHMSLLLVLVVVLLLLERLLVVRVERCTVPIPLDRKSVV